MKLITSILAVTTSVAAIGCTPAQQAEATKIENVVLLDLAAGYATGTPYIQILDKIDTDVGALVAGQVGVDVALIVNEALALLIDTGEIPANQLPTAKAIVVQLHTATVKAPANVTPVIVPVPAKILATPVPVVPAAH